MGNFLLPQENYHYFEYPYLFFILNQGLKTKTIRVFCLKIILQSCQCFDFKHFSCKLKFWGKKIESIHWYSHPASALLWFLSTQRHFLSKRGFWRNVSQVAVRKAGWELSKISFYPLCHLSVTPALLSATCQCHSYHWDIKIKGLLYQLEDSGLIKMVEGAALEHTYM